MKPLITKALLAFFSCLLLALVTSLPATPAWARIELSTASSSDIQQAVVSTPHVRAELMAHAPQGFAAGHEMWLGVQLTPQPGWHTYWKNPGDSGLPTELSWTLPEGWQVGPVLWPTPDVLPVGDRVNYGYEHPVLLSVPVQRIRASDSPIAIIQVKASWLVCKTECIPESVNLKLSLPQTGVVSEHAAAFTAAETELPRKAPEVQSQAQLKGTDLSLRITGLPAAWSGQALWAIPETADIVSTTLPKGSALPTWSTGSNPSWEIVWPLSDLREQSPQRLRWVIRTQNKVLGALLLETPIQGKWPPVETSPSPGSLQSPTLSAPTTLVKASPDTALSWGAVLAAFVGGLILNLMPCVFPVLAIKLLSLLKSQTNASNQPGHSLRAQCLAYSFGVVASFIALGGLILALRAGGAQLGWGFQLQSPWMIAFLALLFTAMALNLAGVYEWRGGFDAGLSQVHWRHPWLNSAFSGVIAVLIASPCTAPFMGTSLGLTLTLPALSALTVFAALGLGMAFPYLLLGLWPSAAPWWMRHLPKPGAWMQTFKQIMAFPLLATVIWLLWVLGQQVGIDGVVVVLSLSLILSGALWAWGLPEDSFTKIRPALVGIFMVLGAWVTWNWGELAVRPAVVPTATNAPDSPLVWQTWKPGLAEARAAQGQSVFVDFTAAWCVTCQFNKHATLSDAGLLHDLAQHQVMLLRADWTRQDPTITQALRDLGRSGVPVYVAYVPGRAPVVLSELLSVAEVRAALNLP